MKLSPSHIPFRRLPALLLLCVAYAALQAAALRPAVAIPFPLLLLKSAIDSLTLAGTGALLSMIITSSGYVKLRPLQRYINLLALGLAALPVWTALFSLTLRLVSGSTGFAGSLPLLPLATLLGILLYVILLQATLHRTADREEKTEEEEDGDGEDGCREQPEAERAIPAAPPRSGKGREDTGGTWERVTVRVGQKIHLIPVPEIVCIRSDGDYVQIVTDREKFLKEETMKYFEAGLPPALFVRVHRSCIVNVEKILRIERYEKQQRILILKNGDRVRTSTPGYRALQSALNL